MAELKLTKNELRLQQQRLAQLEKYLPTLKLKKALLQQEIVDARHDVLRIEGELKSAELDVLRGSKVLSMEPSINVETFTAIDTLICESENIAGVEVPVFRSIVFTESSYKLSQTPVWLDQMIDLARQFKTLVATSHVATLRVEALEEELRSVSIRVNLFEKVLIPRASAAIKRIKIFLQDQELAGVARAKVAKSKHIISVVGNQEEVI